MKKVVFLVTSILITALLTVSSNAFAQDTIRVSLQDFLQLGKDHSSLLKARQQSVFMAESRFDEARANRYLPRFELTTAHGLVPGVKSTSDQFNYSDAQLYLDPSLRNDWENWAFFTRAEVSAIQPIYTWGAITNAIEAAKYGSRVAMFDFQTASENYDLQLTELYYSRLLALEMHRLINDARSDIQKAEDKLKEFLEEGEHDIEESDIFKFNIYKYEFFAKADEVDYNLEHLNSIWNLALGNTSNHVIYLPDEIFLDPMDANLADYQYYEAISLLNHPDVKKVDAVVEAARHGLHATRAKQFPTIVLGLTAAYAITPNRPKQENPFIINNTNYESIRYGLGIRQNLNFGILRSEINRSENQYKQAGFARDAAREGAVLNLRDKYKAMFIAQSRLKNSGEALQFSNEWLRVEQLDYDLGFGDVKKLIEAIRINLELEFTNKQRIYEYNISIARLYNASGIPLSNIK